MGRQFRCQIYCSVGLEVQPTLLDRCVDCFRRGTQRSSPVIAESVSMAMTPQRQRSSVVLPAVRSQH